MNYNEIISRLKKFYEFQDDKKIAGKLGLSQQDFSNRKKRGTLLDLIIDKSLHENVNIHWLLTGEGAMVKGSPGREDPGEEDYKNEDFKKAVARLRVIFESRDEVFIEAIKANLHSFERAILRDYENKELRVQIEKLEIKLTTLQSLIDKVIPLGEKNKSSSETEM